MEFSPTDAYNEVPNTKAGDGMGLSTQVEISDHGSRRMPNDAGMHPVNEEDDDESGRTGPAGTIGGDAA